MPTLMRMDKTSVTEVIFPKLEKIRDAEDFVRHLRLILEAQEPIRAKSVQQNRDSCYPLTSYGSTCRRNSVAACGAFVTPGQAKAKRWSPSRVRSCSLGRHPLRPPQRHPLGDAPQRAGLWQWHDLLASSSRLANVWCLGPPPPGLARSARPSRSHRLEPRLH